MEKGSNGMKFQHLCWDVNIIGTGSKGNAVRVGDILFDCGLPFKELQPHLMGVKYLCITHEHGDHINISTIKKICKLYPFIQVIVASKTYTNKLLDLNHRNVTRVKPRDVIELSDGRKLHIVLGEHSVFTIGFIVEEVDGSSYIYSTDNKNWKPFKNYLLANKHLIIKMILGEANYDRERLNTMQEKLLTDLDKASTRKDSQKIASKLARLDGSLVHSSKQDFWQFAISVRENRDTKIVQLHMSSEFY